jgi:hypothetical protein
LSSNGRNERWCRWLGSMLNPTNGARRFRLMILDACFTFQGRHFCE